MIIGVVSLTPVTLTLNICKIETVGHYPEYLTNVLSKFGLDSVNSLSSSGGTRMCSIMAKKGNFLKVYWLP